MNHAVTDPLLLPPFLDFAHASYGDSQLHRPPLTHKELGGHRATFKDVKNTLATIQSRQDAQRVMMNLTRIQPFLSAMLAYSEVVHVTHDASECIAAIWGSLKLMLEVAHAMPKAFDNLLEAYEQLGEATPSLGQKQKVFEVHPRLIKIVELMYADLLEFHEHGIAIFDRPSKYEAVDDRQADQPHRMATALRCKLERSDAAFSCHSQEPFSAERVD